MKLIKNKVYYNKQRPLTHSMIYSLPSWTTNMKIACLASQSTATNIPQLYHTDMRLWYMTYHSYTKICTICLKPFLITALPMLNIVKHILFSERYPYTCGLTDVIFAFICNLFLLWLPLISLYVCLNHTHKIVWKCVVLTEFTLSQ